MKKLFLRLKTKTAGKRGGFSLAEVVVSLAVITIICTSALSFISAQVRAEAKAVATIEATNIAENAIECFRYAEKNQASITQDDTEQQGKSQKVLLFETTFDECADFDENNGAYTVKAKHVTAEIKIDDKANSIEIKAVHGNDTILTTKYTYPAT